MINAEKGFCRMQCVRPLSFGIATGVVVALFMLIVGLLAMAFGIGTGLVETLSTFYLGYGITITGLIIGVGWGFAEGFVCGYLIIWICMRLNGRCETNI